MATLFCKPRTSRGQGHERMGHGSKVKPQATLSFVPGGPPVLDPGPSKPQSSTRGSWPAWTSPGYVWSHLSNMLTAPQPLRWVNPQVVLDCPPPPLSQYQVVPYSVVDQSGNLWHPAPPGGLQQQMMMEPQQMLQSYNTAFPCNKMEGPAYPSNFPPYKAPTKSLNPNAQEWVPREYRNNPSATPTSPSMGCVEEKGPHNNHLQIPNIPKGCLDFCEITEEEVKDVRMNGCHSSSDVPATSGNDGVEQCQVPVPQCPPVVKCDQSEEVTPAWSKSSPRIEKSVEKGTNQTCRESMRAAERKVESSVQSCQSSSPVCTWENGVSPTVIPEENESPLCVTSVCDEVRKSVGPGQSISEFQRSCCSKENTTSPVPVCLNSERPRPTSGSPGSDQTQQSAVSPAERLARGLLTTEEVNCALLNQRNSSLASPSQTSPAKNTSEGHRVSPEHQPTSPVRDGKGASTDLTPDHKCTSVRASLEVPQCPQCPENATGSSASLSYAGVVGRATPSPPPPVDTPEHQKYKGVEQPLPKIFQVDRTPPREDGVPQVQGERKTPELFRRPSKTQKTKSRKFLQELKESGQNGDSCVWSGLPSSTPDVSHSPDDVTSPSSSPLILPALPVSSPRCAPSMASSSPQAIPIASPEVMESPGSRARSSSESSIGSLDIDFVEQDEVDRVAVDSEMPTKERDGLGLGGKNGFLACILGSGDSDSDSKDESDLDWDEVCEDDVAPGLDDSWETFGFGLVVLECHVAPLQTHCPAEAPKAEDHYGDPILHDINKRWEEEVRKDVRGRSAQRVKFGGEKVHPMVVWGHAYREARRGPWEQQARDRARFAQRVASLEPELSLVLDPGHRRAMYRRLHAPPSRRCFL